MRIGIQLPDSESFKEVRARARAIEAAGFDGIWRGHHMPVAGGDAMRTRPDPLTLLLLSAISTQQVEIGTCIYCLPLSNPALLAQQVYTLQSFAPGRLTFGVGTGSQRLEYEQAGLQWEERFSRLDGHLALFRSIYETELGAEVEQRFERLRNLPPGRSVGSERHLEPSLPMRVGLPRLALGAWHSETQLKRAATQYDAWIASAGPGSRFGGWRKVLSEGIRRYRDLGGRRALLATVPVNLEMPESALDDLESFNLRCGPESAAERLHEIEELGFDDVIIHVARSLDSPGISGGDFHPGELEAVRSLLPRDERDYRV